MFSFIRYTIYLFIILLCLFFLQKWGVDVRGGIDTSVARIKIFAKSIYNTPSQSGNKIVDDIFTKSPKNNVSTTTLKSYTDSINNLVKISTINTENINILKPKPGMSIEGVLYYTNIERKKYGLSAFVLEKKLNQSAIIKIDDMFDQQYFEHVSPSGKTAADLVRQVKYDFQAVSENLALGDFGNDKKLVEAWMNSPSHRKNILNPKFTELGLAVAKGEYKANTQWLAVQHFGKPIPACPPVVPSLKVQIETEKKSLELEEVELQKMASEIESDPNQNKGKDFLDTYNARVASYNAKLGTLRDLIKEYNSKIETYNECLQS